MTRRSARSLERLHLSTIWNDDLFTWIVSSIKCKKRCCNGAIAVNAHVEHWQVANPAHKVPCQPENSRNLSLKGHVQTRTLRTSYTIINSCSLWWASDLTPQYGNSWQSIRLSTRNHSILLSASRVGANHKSLSLISHYRAYRQVKRTRIRHASGSVETTLMSWNTRAPSHEVSFI